MATTQTSTALPERFVARSTGELRDRLGSTAADIVIAPQDLSLDLEQLVLHAALQERRFEIACEQPWEQISQGLREMEIFDEALAAKMVCKVELFCSLFGQSQVELCWEVTDRQSCPKFHCDNVYTRMLVTYYGPTTEFIDRNEPDTIYRVPINAIVLLKGHKHPTYQDCILHRSPKFAEGEKRLCVTINFCDWLPNH